MTPESAFTFFIAIFIFSITPGPGVFAILAQSLSRGARSCFMLALGMTASDIVYLIAACMGLAYIASQWSELFTVIRWIGAAYLLYLGWKMWNTPPEFETEAEHLPGKSGAVLSFLQGFLISASNPKVILFYVAFLPSFMDLTLLDEKDIAIASLLTLIGLMTGIMSIAFFAAKARKYLTSAAAVRKLNRSAGSIMMSAGIYLVVRS